MRKNQVTLAVKQLMLAVAAMFGLMAAGHAQILLQVYGKAQAADPDFAAARANYESEVRARDIAGAAFMPSLALSASAENAQYQRKDSTFPYGKVNAGYDPVTTTLRLTQPVFSLDRIGFMRENEARAARAQWVLDQARQDLALRVAQAVFNLMLSRDQLALAQAQADALNAQLVQLEALLVSRSSTRTDVADARARFELAKVQIRQAQSLLAVRRLELAKLVGPSLPELPDGPSASMMLAEPDPAGVDAWVAAASERAFKVLAQGAAVQIQTASALRAKSALYPSLSLYASTTQGKSTNYFTASDRTDSIGMQLTMSIFDGGIGRAQLDQAEQQVVRARHELESAQKDAAVTAGQAYWGVVNGAAQIRAMQEAVAAAELALEGTRMGIKANIKTYADELNALQLLFANRRDLQKERYSYLLSRLQLAMVAGADESAIRRVLADLGV